MSGIGYAKNLMKCSFSVHKPIDIAKKDKYSRGI